jgi:hypothetical protein
MDRETARKFEKLVHLVGFIIRIFHTPLYYINDNYVCMWIMVPNSYTFVEILVLFTAFLCVYMFVYVFCHLS